MAVMVEVGSARAAGATPLATGGAAGVAVGLAAGVAADLTADLTADVARWCAATEALLAHDAITLEAPEAARLHRRLRSGCDRVLALASRLLTKVEEDGRWTATGARTFPEWVAGQSGASVRTARRETSLGRALEGDLPATRRAVTAGQITLEHALVMSRFAPTSDTRREALASPLPDRNEASLVAKARRMGADEFGREVRRWAMAVDHATAEREHQGLCAQERFNLIRRDGGVSVDGFLTVEHGDVVATALRAVIGVPAQDDKRTPDQRRAAALTDLARLVLDKGLSGGGTTVRPHISVHVSWDAYCRLARESAEDCGAAGTGAGGVGGGSGSGAAFGFLPPAELDDGEPIPSSVLARIACDSAITRVVFGPRGEPLDVGRTQRTFTGAQRRAVIARDRTCCYPGCSAQPVLGEVHHVAWWARDRGATSVENGILLCWHHHDLVHQRDLAIHRTQEARWEFRRRDGTTIRAPGAPPGSGRRSGAPPGEGWPADPR